MVLPLFLTHGDGQSLFKVLLGQVCQIWFGMGSFVILVLFYFYFLLGSEVIYLPVVAEVA